MLPVLTLHGLVLYFNAMPQSDWLMRGSIKTYTTSDQNMVSNAQNELVGPGKTSQYQDLF